jgi:hypothetical protein
VFREVLQEGDDRRYRVSVRRVFSL